MATRNENFKSENINVTFENDRVSFYMNNVFVMSFGKNEMLKFADKIYDMYNK